MKAIFSVLFFFVAASAHAWDCRITSDLKGNPLEEAKLQWDSNSGFLTAQARFLGSPQSVQVINGTTIGFGRFDTDKCKRIVREMKFLDKSIQIREETYRCQVGQNLPFEMDLLLLLHYDFVERKGLYREMVGDRDEYRGFHFEDCQ